MRPSVKLYAIAMNEGPYLVDWVFHHLHFGFDAIEIWINGTEDSSTTIMTQLQGAVERVGFEDADGLRDECTHDGRFFQYEAYAQMAQAASRDGFTHIAFLDLDEYWVPRDFHSSIHDFLPPEQAVNVVSFPWCLDVPDAARRAFDHPLSAPVAVQLDHHVKSVVRLDERVRQFRPHTARTSSGRRLLVRDRFPMRDRHEQQWGSLVQWDSLLDGWETVPEAFVLHAVNRSEVEYLASMRKVIRRSPTESAYRSNRLGFGARARPVLLPDLPPGRVSDYQVARAEFVADLDVDTAVEAAQRTALRRVDQLDADLADDPVLRERLREALRGVDDRRIDRHYADRDYRLEWCVDELDLIDERVVMSGWLFSDVRSRDIEFAVRDATGRVLTAASVAWSARPDVPPLFPGAPVECGFRGTFEVDRLFDLSTMGLVARPAGATTWQEEPSRLVAPRPA